MIEAYKRYKDWWLEYKAYATESVKPGFTYLGFDEESVFLRHINSMTNYELMETLVDWSDNPELPTGN